MYVFYHKNQNSTHGSIVASVASSVLKPVEARKWISTGNKLLNIPRHWFSHWNIIGSDDVH